MSDNSMARLWWGAEFTKVQNIREVCQTLGLADSEDSYHFTRYLLSSYDIHRAVLSREFCRVRTMGVGFLAGMYSIDAMGPDVRKVVKDLNLSLSTVLAEGFGAGERGYSVDPDRCREAANFCRKIARHSLSRIQAGNLLEAPLEREDSAAEKASSEPTSKPAVETVRPRQPSRSRVRGLLDRLGRWVGGTPKKPGEE